MWGCLAEPLQLSSLDEASKLGRVPNALDDAEHVLNDQRDTRALVLAEVLGEQGQAVSLASEAKPGWESPLHLLESIPIGSGIVQKATQDLLQHQFLLLL